MKRALLVLVVAGASCSQERVDAERVDRLESTAAHYDSALDQTAARAARLGKEWDEVRKGYELAASGYRSSQTSLTEAAAAYGQASDQYIEAAKTAERAASKWRLYQKLIVVTAAVDAANLDAARGTSGVDESLDCDAGMSRARFRELLLAQGTLLAGMDVDHIVPKSLGGADHPSNYQLLDSSENRSLGNAWDEAKCQMAGEERCLRAVAVSQKCGSLRGFGF